MGAPVFTEAELRRVLKVAAELDAAVEVNPRRGTIRILARGSAADLPSSSGEADGDEQKCDEAFGL